jgi:hypothetical protein
MIRVSEILGDGGVVIKAAKKLALNGEGVLAFTKGDWSSGMIPVLGTGGPGFNSRIAPFFQSCQQFPQETEELAKVCLLMLESSPATSLSSPEVFQSL